MLSTLKVASTRSSKEPTTPQQTPAILPRNQPTLVTDEAALATSDARRKYASDKIQRHDVELGLVLLVEGSSTLEAEDTKRIDIINPDNNY